MKDEIRQNQEPSQSDEWTTLHSYLRLTVRRVIELLATYPDRQELVQEFPELEEEDIQQALIFASSYMDDRIIELPASYETIA